MYLLFAAKTGILFFLCCSRELRQKIVSLKVYLFVFQYVSYYQMNIKQIKTHHTPPNKAHTQPKQDGGRGVHNTAIIWCKHPFQKKIKKFQKRKNQKNKIQNTQIFEIAFILVSNLRCIAFLCIEW